MADTKTLTATLRTEFGKGAARRARRAGLVPAVLYGHGAEPRHLALPSHETFLVLKDTTNAVLTVSIEGEQHLALAKDIQLDPVKRTIEHVDLVEVTSGERVTVEVPVQTTGESAPGTIHTIEVQTLTVTVPASRIPEHVTVPIDGLADGTVVRVRDIPRPPGADVDDDPETVVVVISVPRASTETAEEEESTGD